MVMFFLLNVLAESEVRQVGIGDKLQLLELTDQFDNKQTLKSETQWLVFSHDMASGDLVELTFCTHTCYIPVLMILWNN